MKIVFPALLVILLLQVSVSVFATDYYCIKNGNAADLNTWNSSRTGNGTSPVNFSNPEDNFIVQKDFAVTNKNNFSCAGSLILENGGIYNTGNSGNTINIASVITINDGATLKLSPKTTLVAGFILIQGKLENLGGEIKFSSPVATLNHKSF